MRPECFQVFHCALQPLCFATTVLGAGTMDDSASKAFRASASLGKQWTIPLFACITSQEDEVDSVLSSVGIDSGLLSDPLSRAALRLLRRRCRQTLDQPTTAKSEVVTAPGSSDSSWSETFPPKISHEALSTQFSVSLGVVGPRQHAKLTYDGLAAPQYSRRALASCAWRFRLSVRQKEEQDLGPRFAKRSKLS